MPKANEMPTKKINCVGLFGTCAGSRWREPFKDVYRSKKIDFFDPQVMPDTHGREWSDIDIPREKAHLRYDSVVLFPVLSCSDGLGSLSEVGFSILHAIRMDESRDVIVLIEPRMSSDVEVHSDIRKRSDTARSLVAAHLSEMDYHNLTIVRSMDDMLAASLDLFFASEARARSREMYHCL